MEDSVWDYLTGCQNMGRKSSRERSRKNDSDEDKGESDAPSSSASTSARESTGHRATEDLDRARGKSRPSGSGTSIQRAATAGRVSGQTNDTRGSGEGYVDYDPGPDRQALSARYGLDVREGEARRLKRLEEEFGSSRVQRWVNEGIPVETMGKPRDVQAFRERRSAGGSRDEGRDSTQSASPGQSADGSVQPKLEVSSPDDPAEREAEVVAEQVVEMDEPAEQSPDQGGDSGVEDVAPGRVLERHRRDAVQLVDVRSPTAYRNGHVPGAVNVPAPEITRRDSGIDGDRDVALYCRSGRRSRQVARYVAARNDSSPSRVLNVSGGYNAVDADRRSGTPSTGTGGHTSRNCGCKSTSKQDAPGIVDRFERGVGPVQASFEVSQPTDTDEREARRVADRVMRMAVPPTHEGAEPNGPTGRGLPGGVTVRERPSNTTGFDWRLHRLCPDCLQRTAYESGHCTECDAELPEGLTIKRSVSPSEGGTQVGATAEERVRSVQSGGQPLPESARSFFEPRFGRDFSDVRIHTGPRADEAASSINAEAFTVGSDIAFASGNYEPGTTAGKELLAHELTHVVQQGEAGRQVRRAVGEESKGSGKVITVKRGDTLSGIAQQARQRYEGFDGTYEDLWQFNKDHMKGDTPHEIYPGEKVYIPEQESGDGGGGSGGETDEDAGTPEEGETPEEEVMVATLCHRPFRHVQNHVTAENRETLRENLEAAARWVPFVGEDEVDTLVEKVWNAVEEVADEARHCFVWLHPEDTLKATPQSQSDMESTFTYDLSTNGRYDEGALGSDVVCTGTFSLDDPGCVEAGYSACDTDEYNLGLFNCCSCAHQSLEEVCGVSTSPSHFPPQNQGIGLPEEYGSGAKRTIVETAGKLMEKGADAIDALRDLYDYYF